MVQFETTGVGCVLILKAVGDHEGELTIEELEEIDDVMLEVGASRTGQRTDVETTRMANTVRVEYAYQESMNHRSPETAAKRLDAFTVLEDPFIVIDVATAEFVEEKNG